MTPTGVQAPGNERVLILGAGGFIGSRLALSLAQDPVLAGRPLSALWLCDRHPVAAPPKAKCPVHTLQGELDDPGFLQAVFAQAPTTVFHLAAALTLDAEADYRRGLQVNVLALIQLLEGCRTLPSPPRLLFASSISTYGGPLPAVVDDFVVQAPDTSYGTHKVIAEQLIRDASRRGFVDGRVLRLPIVLTHPGPASGSISDQVAALIREPLQGRTVTCRLAPDASLVVASVETVVVSLRRLAGLPAADMVAGRVMNLPGLGTTPAQIVEAVARQRPAAAAGPVIWQADAQVQRIVAAWPRAFTSARALALGLRPDASIDSIVHAYQQTLSGPVA